MLSSNLHALPPVDPSDGAHNTFPPATLQDEGANRIGGSSIYTQYQTWTNKTLAGHNNDDVDETELFYDAIQADIMATDLGSVAACSSAAAPAATVADFSSAAAAAAAFSSAAAPAAALSSAPAAAAAAATVAAFSSAAAEGIMQYTAEASLACNMSSAGLLGALNQPFNELRSLIPTTTPTTMFTDSNKAPTYSYNLPVIGSHAPPVFGSRTLPVIGSHTQPVIGPHTQPVIRSHTQPVIGSHTLPVIGSHTQSFQNLFNPPKHQLLPNSPTFVGRSTNEQYQVNMAPRWHNDDGYIFPGALLDSRRACGLSDSVTKPTFIKDECMVDAPLSQCPLSHGGMVGAPACEEASGSNPSCSKTSAPDSDNTHLTLGSADPGLRKVEFTSHAGGADKEGDEHSSPPQASRSMAEAPLMESDPPTPTPTPPSHPHLPPPTPHLPPPPPAPSTSKAALAELYHRPMKAAANMLGMSMNSLKTLCLDYKIQRWPHRKLASIDILLETGPVLESNPTKRQRLTSLLHSLRQGILDDPNLPIPEEVEKTRQRLYKRRHLEQARMGSSQTTQTV